MASTEAQIAHVWRRLGFGPRPDDVSAAGALGPRGLIDELLARTPTTRTEWRWPKRKEKWEEYTAFTDRNLELMATSSAPVQERVYWLLSQILVIATTDRVQYNDHKVHVQTLRSWPTSNYKKLLTAVAKSTGMQEYLGGVFSTPPHPNENLARELLELFSLGVTHPLTGAGNYSETDVKEIARALTGYRFDWTKEKAYFDSRYWDAGSKRFLGADRGAAALTHVTAAVARHDSFKYFVPQRLYRELVGLDPTPAVLRSLGGEFGSSGNLGAVVAAIARRPEFLSDDAVNSRVKSPVELVLATIRTLGLQDLPRLGLPWILWELGQHPFHAPNVDGWPSGTDWLHSGHFVNWSHYAAWWAFSDDGTETVPEARRVPTVRRLHQEGSGATGGDLALTLAGLHDVSPATRQAVRDLAGAGHWNHWRAAAVMHLVLLSPEYAVN